MATNNLGLYNCININAKPSLAYNLIFYQICKKKTKTKTKHDKNPFGCGRYNIIPSTYLFQDD